MGRCFVIAPAFVAALAGCSGNSGTAPPDEPSRDSGAPAVATCPEGFDPFEAGDSQPGALGMIEAELVDAEPRVATKFRNVWTLALRRVDGASIEDFRVTRVQTFMPVHGHPGQPESSATWQDGRLRTELHFTMRGPWEVRLELASESSGMENFVFDVCVRE